MSRTIFLISLLFFTSSLFGFCLQLFHTGTDTPWVTRRIWNRSHCSTQRSGVKYTRSSQK
jgi:hypothetical protein